MPVSYRDHANITEAILGFAEYARSHDMNVGIREAQEALRVASLGLIQDKKYFRYALKSVFCTSADNIVLFDDLFSNYWETPYEYSQSSFDIKSKINVQKPAVRSLVFIGKGGNKEAREEDASEVSGANKIEKLRKTDFSKVTDIDSAFLEKLAINLWQQMSRRLKKKLKNSTTKGIVDIRQTIRSNIGRGGTMLELKLKNKKPDRNRLVILLDVSGSMDKYSFYLLRFILALRAYFQNIEAFIFSTKLIRITEYLKSKNLEKVLAHLSAGVDNWSSGTKIGACLESFNDMYAKRSLNGRSMTIILSDGLDTGEPELLSRELSKIKRRTRKLIWLNPLKGMTGYQPLAQGMKAALPEIDVFRSAHSLDSILELEKYLAHV